jgi:hypothetical protein
MTAQETVAHGVADALDLDAALRALHVATFHLDQLAADFADAGDQPVEQTRLLVRQATAVLARAQ